MITLFFLPLALLLCLYMVILLFMNGNKKARLAQMKNLHLGRLRRLIRRANIFLLDELCFFFWRGGVSMQSIESQDGQVNP